jgi:hypothetical protein
MRPTEPLSQTIRGIEGQLCIAGFLESPFVP